MAGAKAGMDRLVGLMEGNDCWDVVMGRFLMVRYYVVIRFMGGIIWIILCCGCTKMLR